MSACHTCTPDVPLLSFLRLFWQLEQERTTAPEVRHPLSPCMVHRLKPGSHMPPMHLWHGRRYCLWIMFRYENRVAGNFAGMPAVEFCDGSSCRRRMFPFDREVVQAVPAATSQIHRRHMRTRLYWRAAMSTERKSSIALMNILRDRDTTLSIFPFYSFYSLTSGWQFKKWESYETRHINDSSTGDIRNPSY